MSTKAPRIVLDLTPEPQTGTDRVETEEREVFSESTDAPQPHRPRRGERVADAQDEAEQAELIALARQRRVERIEKSSERQRRRKEAKLQKRRLRVARRVLPEGHSLDWDAPATRVALDKALTDARERRLFGLPPRPELETGGMSRILSAKKSKTE